MLNKETHNREEAFAPAMAAKKKGPSSKGKGIKKGQNGARGKSAELRKIKGFDRVPTESITGDIARESFKFRDELPLEGKDGESKDTGDEKKKSLKPGDPGFKWSEEFAHKQESHKTLTSMVGFLIKPLKGPSVFDLDAEDLAIFDHPSVQLRYGPLEMMARAMQAENMYSRVMLEASRRWCLDLQPGPLPEIQLKDPTSVKGKYSERNRRLGRALSVIEATQGLGKPKVKKLAAGEEEDSLWIGPLSGMAPSSALAAAYAVSTMRMQDTEDGDEQSAKAVTAFEGDVCIEEKEPCRRYFSIKCWPCPEHTPGVPREKTCICATEPRPQESFKDAVRFLGMLPRGMHVTYSSLDPERKKKVELRAQSEATWRSHIVQWKDEYQIAHMQAKNIIRNQHAKEHRPPFVEENQSLRRLRGLGSLPLHLV